MTGSADPKDPPFDKKVSDELPDEVTQEMLSAIGAKYVATVKDVALKRKIIADIKKMNGGSANYKAVSNAEARKNIYHYFWNLAIETA